MDYRKAAKKMIENKVVPIPLCKETKIAAVKWKKFQTRFPNDAEIEEHFKDCGGVSALTLPGADEDNLISNLFCLDFDLKYQLPHQDFFKDFGDKIPMEIKRRFYINQTGSGYGRHIWFRVDGFFDKSRKLSYRLKTPEELILEKQQMIKDGIDENIANRNLMKSPYKVVIETRGFNSYGVFLHPSYNHIYGKKIYTFTKEECELIMDAAYSTSELFVERKRVSGNVNTYKTIEKYNEDITASEVMDLLQSTGLISYMDTDYNGNIRFRRTGSKMHSGVIFTDTAVTQIFSNNTVIGDSGAYSPFDIYCKVNHLETHQALKKLKEKR